MNQKNSLGLDSCFKDIDDPLALFTIWLAEADKKEINDPNALSLATINSKNEPSVRMVHERLKYNKVLNKWKKEILYP